MTFELSKSPLTSEVLTDGEYYVFSQQASNSICLGYIYTTWCGSPHKMYMRFSCVAIGKPLPLVRTETSQHDKGHLKTFSFDSRNPDLIDDVYNRAMSWLNQRRGKFQESNLDESAGCLPIIILVKQGVVSAFFEKDDYLKNHRNQSRAS